MVERTFLFGERIGADGHQTTFLFGNGSIGFAHYVIHVDESIARSGEESEVVFQTVSVGHQLAVHGVTVPVQVVDTAGEASVALPLTVYQPRMFPVLFFL